MRENDRQDHAHGEHANTHEHALTSFLRPDIGELCLSDVHRKLPVVLLIFSISVRVSPLNSRDSYIRLDLEAGDRVFVFDIARGGQRRLRRLLLSVFFLSFIPSSQFEFNSTTSSRDRPAVTQSAQLAPADLRMRSAALAAVDAGDDVFLADEFSERDDPIGYKFRTDDSCGYYMLKGSAT